MADNVSSDTEEAPWNFDVDYDFDQWVDPDLLDFSFPDWAGSVDSNDWTAGIPDALGSYNADPIRHTKTNHFMTNHHLVAGLVSADSGTRASRVPSTALVAEDLAEPDGIRQSNQAHPSSFVVHRRKAATSSIVSDHTDVVESQAPSAGPEQVLQTRGRGRLLDRRVDIKCDECDKMFSRGSDLRRHIKTSHESKESFVCNAQGCFRRQLPWSFTRSDKLTSHIKAIHNQDTTFAKCSVAGCSFGPCTLETMGVHIQHLHPNHEQGRAVLNATSCKALRCPLWRCRKYLTSNKLPSHLSSHAVEEVKAELPSIQSSGLVARFAPANEHASRATPKMTIGVLCPVCNAVNDEIEDFIAHFWADHLFYVGGAEHFNKWRLEWASKAYPSNRSAICNAPWSQPVQWTPLEGRHDFVCPSCPFIVTDYGFVYGGNNEMAKKEAEISSHHLSLLRPEAEVVNELYPYRMQILRFYPEFVTHPVFADLDQHQQQTSTNLPDAPGSSEAHIDHDFDFTDWTANSFDPNA